MALAIRAEGLTMSIGRTAAVADLDLDVRPGELLALLGPSGSGKTTLLRLVAGLEVPTAGRLLFGEEDATRLSVRERRVGFVFQNYALFKHLTVAENVAYGLRVKPRRLRPSKAEIRRRVDDLLELVQLGGLGKRYPAQLSGGERQRVALARALAVEPRVLLLDEPLGALDAQVRRDLRRWLREIHDRTGHTTLFVTHDQEEALAMGDRVGVMSAGHLEQIAAPTELYDRPKTRFVAEFVGLTNRIPGTAGDGVVELLGTRVPLLAGSAGPGPVQALVRPEAIRIVADETAGAHVVAVSFLGSVCRAQVALPDETIVVGQLSAAEAEGLAQGIAVRVTVVPSPVFAVAD